MFIMLTLVVLGTASVNAQVTIGSLSAPDKNALLDLRDDIQGLGTASKGLLLPRVKLVSTDNPSPMANPVAGMIVYNTEEAGVGINKVYKGFYINNGASTGTQWERLSSEATKKWFYMPSSPIDVNVAVTDKQVNLHNEYLNQVGNDAVEAGVSAAIRNPGAPAAIDNIIGAGKVYAANELDYYVIDYDKTVFTDVKVSDAGILTYTITTANLANVSDATYMNIIFVVK